jgi:hypothetical protein
MREARPIAVEAGDRYAEADTFLIEAMAASMAAPPEDAGRLAGRPDEAAAFARAVDHWRQLGLTVWLGRSLALQATATRRTADPPAADGS